MKKLFLLLVLAGCGDSSVTVGGTVEVKHQIDIGSFEAYYRTYCESLYTTELMIEQCTADKMAALFESLINAGLL